MRNIKFWNRSIHQRLVNNDQSLKTAWLRMLFFILVTAPHIALANEASHLAQETKVNPKILEGQRYFAEHRYAAAEETFRHALDGTPTTDNKTVIDLLNSIGATLHAQKKDVEAIAIFNRALKALPKSLPDGDIRKGKILSNLSLAYSALGQTEKAMQCSENALSNFHVHKAGSSDLGVLLNSYGRLKMDAGDYTKAEALFIESVSVRETSAGKDSITLVSPLINLSGAFLRERKLTEAESTCRRAINICQQQDGKESEMLFPLLVNLGSLQVEQSRHKEAIDTFSRARAIAEKHFGRNSEEALMTCFALSEYYERDGQTKQAEQVLSRGVEISRLLFGNDSSKTIEATLALAQLFQIHGNSAEAERLRGLCRLSQGSRYP